jgi:hypothetical protein
VHLACCAPCLVHLACLPSLLWNYVERQPNTTRTAERLALCTSRAARLTVRVYVVEMLLALSRLTCGTIQALLCLA